MLENYFEAAPTLVRLRSGPSGPFIDAFGQELQECGYARRTVRRHLRAAAHLGAWMDLEGLAFGLLDEQALGAFAKHLPACTCFESRRGDRSHGVAGTRLFLAYLREWGVVSSAAKSAADGLPEIVQRFEHWMQRHRGVTASTLAAYRPILVELVEKLGEPADFAAATLRKFLSDRAAHQGRSRTKTTASAMRMFLRYLVAQGLCDPSLVDAIPPMAAWRLSSLPAYISPEDVERIVRAADTATPVGRRDRAILLLLARLGLRAGDVVDLRLTDIDWHAGTLLVRGKERRTSRLPLPQDVGDAILAYLADGRPCLDDEHVFLAVQAPTTKLRSSTAVSCIVVSAAKRAGVRMPRGRAHVLRHSTATALLRKGLSLSAVGALLRHQCEESTAHYAKVDTSALRRIARPWPIEVSPC